MRRGRSRGQSLVEFALVFPLFMLMVFAIVDFGRGIYQFNGVSQAAREIARAASVHYGSDFSSANWTQQVKDVIATQQKLVPGLTVNPATGIVCVDANGNIDTPCNFPADSVKVTVTASFRGITPIISALGQWTMQGASSVQIQ